ncbi:MAG: DUF3108 domain-containing protein [SAR324 cluster bacterium]|nr:DUF3108 domain-containing protein [SAR324 cluster bacterium]
MIFKILILLFFLNFGLIDFPYSQEAANAEEIMDKELQIGEKLKYEVSFSGLMTLGYAEMSIEGETQIRGQKCLVFQTKTWATPFLQRIYTVDDRITSHWNPVLKRTLWQEKIIHEGTFYREYQADFNYKLKVVSWTQKGYSVNTTGGESQGVTTNLPSQIQDALSSVYFSRTHELQGKPGLKFELAAFDDLKIAKIKMEIIRIEDLALVINGKSQTFSAQVIEPKYSTTGLFRAKGRLFLWVTNDKNKIPLQIISEIPIGSVKARLIEANHPLFLD